VRPRPRDADDLQGGGAAGDRLARALQRPPPIQSNRWSPRRPQAEQPPEPAAEPPAAAPQKRRSEITQKNSPDDNPRDTFEARQPGTTRTTPTDDNQDDNPDDQSRRPRCSEEFLLDHEASAIDPDLLLFAAA